MRLTLPPLAPPAELEARIPAGLDPGIATAAAHAWTHAPFLRGLLRREDRLAAIASRGFDAVIAGTLASVRDASADAAGQLRAAKGELALAVALADLSGCWSLEQVTRALSDFADAAIDAAIAAALAERGAENRGFFALALGKLGSHELNYSSDVDLILLYDPALMPCRPREEPAEAAVRIARRVVALMSERRADGYVFRVDLRLRPASEITPMALSVAAAEHYYQSEALTWERVAFIRARVCGGDAGLGAAFLASIRGFVWRRSLDYTAIHDIQAVSLRIRDHFEAGQALGPGFDLKRGRGGIREVEFFTQIHQLIWGGRDVSLRAPATLDGLAALAAAGRLEAGDAANMAHAYRMLRTVEHRLQMRDDEQTHVVPTSAPARAALAKLCGMADYRSLERRLGAATKAVARRYDRLIVEATGAPDRRLPRDAKALTGALKPHGAALATALPPLIARWRDGSYRSLRSDEARQAFEQVLPALAGAIGRTADPARAATRLDSVLAQLPAGLQFFALLNANPKLIDLLARLLGLTPVLADALARDPALFDVLLGGDAFAGLAPAAVLIAELRGFVGDGDLQQALDRVRRWTHERRFQLGAQLIERRADPRRVAADLSAVADAALIVLAEAVAADMARVNGQVAGQRLVVLAVGRYGGGELTHASDLDLIYLFTGEIETLSDGAKPLGATAYFNRLATRLTTALSVGTATGTLYEVDTRLRPWGAKGLLAVSLDSFARYQLEQAETWEHMALTRARVVVGSDADRQWLADTAAAAIGTRAASRSATSLRDDVVAMRGEMAAAKPGGGLWDVKLAPGGLVDIEFLVHYLQLRDGIALVADLGAAIAVLIGERALPPELGTAHALLGRVLILLRLLEPGGGAPSGPAAALLAAATGHGDAAALERALTLAKRQVVTAWQDLFERSRRMGKIA